MAWVKKSTRKILRKNSAEVGRYNEEIYAEEILIQNNIHAQMGNFVSGRSISVGWQLLRAGLFLVMWEHVANLYIDGTSRRM